MEAKKINCRKSVGQRSSRIKTEKIVLVIHSGKSILYMKSRINNYFLRFVYSIWLPYSFIDKKLICCMLDEQAKIKLGELQIGTEI